jgi:hypothetical protein
MLTNNNTIYGDLGILVDDCRELLKRIPHTKGAALLQGGQFLC